MRVQQSQGGLIHAQNRGRMSAGVRDKGPVDHPHQPSTPDLKLRFAIFSEPTNGLVRKASRWAISHSPAATVTAGLTARLLSGESRPGGEEPRESASVP